MLTAAALAVIITAIKYVAVLNSVILYQNQVNMAITSAPSQPCEVYEIDGKKVYQGCDIDYSQFSAKSATDIDLKAKLMALPLDRQRELNYQLKQTQATIKTYGRTWQANWNDKMILSEEEKKYLFGLLGQPPKLPKSKGLSKSLEAHPDIFSSLFVSMVRAGEESGKLSGSLRIVADQLEKANNISKKIKGAMIYPAVIISVMLVIGFILMVYMVPMLTETFKGLNILRILHYADDRLVAIFV